MSNFEIILSALSGTSLVGNVMQFVTMRAARRKSEAEASTVGFQPLFPRDGLRSRTEK